MRSVPRPWRLWKLKAAYSDNAELHEDRRAIRNLKKAGSRFPHRWGHMERFVKTCGQ
jgi:hypothetical protein